jgi:hypothetical protein
LVWRSVVGGLDGKLLVFVDEMGTHTSLALLYGYSPRGQRAFFKVPRNRGTNTTLLSSMGLEGMGPSMAIEGSTTKEVFESYIEHFLAPTLRVGQVVIMDNLSVHKGERVRKVIEDRGCVALRGCSIRRSASVSKSREPLASSVNRPISTALRSVFEPQKPRPRPRIRSGVNCSLAGEPLGSSIRLLLPLSPAGCR